MLEAFAEKSQIGKGALIKKALGVHRVYPRKQVTGSNRCLLHPLKGQVVEQLLHLVGLCHCDGVWIEAAAVHAGTVSPGE